MNEELKRIRAKDFTSIDQKLFEDLSRADNLTSTLTHLSDFQKFLMEQISSLNSTSAQSKSSLIAKSIAKNFDELKESLVKCSRLKVRPDISLANSLKEQISSLKKELKQVKENVKGQVDSAVRRNSENVQSSVGQILSTLEGEKRKREQLSKRCEELQREKIQLNRQNERLKQKILQNAGNQSIPVVQSTQPILHHRTEYDHRTPLADAVNLQRVNTSSLTKEEGWKQARNKIAFGASESNNESVERRNSSVKRQTSSHELPRKSHLHCLKDKENEYMILKSKGVAVQELKRGRSRQKIKLFSMI